MSSFTSSSSQNYLGISLIAFLIFSLSAAGINYLTDPAGIYHQDDDLYNNLAAITLNSENGVVLPKAIDERKYKKALALNFKHTDCIIIGSSHVMQVSSHRHIKSLPTLCNSLINLGVSGATLEDYIVSSEIVLKNKSISSNLKFVFGIDPWSMGFDRDERWVNYGNHEISIISSLRNENRKTIHSTSKYLNLINFDYLYQSLNHLLSTLDTQYESVHLNQAVNPDIGIDSPVTLPDGSIIYSKDTISNFSKTPIPYGGSHYKSDHLDDKEAIALFEDQIRKILNSGHPVYFLLTPYAPNVFKSTNSKTKSQIDHMEPIIRQLANNLGIPVFGSYYPQNIGCDDLDFYDHMHPKASCLTKIVTN